MNMFKDIYNFFRILSFVDIVFLIAILILIILIVTLVYFIKINNDVFTENDFFPKLDNNIQNKEEVTNNIVEVSDNNKSNSNEEYNDEEQELIDLKTLTKKLKEDANNERINFTAYEKDQEEKAIISYDELIQKKNKYAINYEKEELIDDVSVKKVNLNDLVNKNEEEYYQDEVRVISYQKEEAFLNALKELNSLLN